VALGLNTLGHVHVVSADRKSSEAAAQKGAPANEYLDSHEIAASGRAIVGTKSVAELLLEESERTGAEFLVMGASRTSRLSEFFLGSTTRRVLKEARIPLLVSN